MPGPEGGPEKYNAGRWQVGEELLGGEDPVFVTCSPPRLAAPCTSLGLGNAGRMGKDGAVGSQVSCSRTSGCGKQGPRGKWRQGQRSRRSSKSSTLGAAASPGGEGPQDPREQARGQSAWQGECRQFPAGHQGWPRLLVGAFLRNWPRPCPWS